MKKILIVYPHNFFETTSGINKMFYNLAVYLKSKKYTVDLLSLKNFEYQWKENSPIDKKIVTNLYLYDFRTIKNTNPSLPDLVDDSMRAYFKDIVLKNEYSHILISYVFWANLIGDPAFTHVKKIVSINDFLTFQLKTDAQTSDEIAKMLGEEIKRINLFDIAISISEFEYAFFSQLTSRPKHYLIPIFTNTPKRANKKEKYDIGFIGFDNKHNISGMSWFLKEVWPKLKNKKMIIVGKIVEQIDIPKSDDITCIPYLSELSELYSQVKLMVSPLFTKTNW